MKIRSFFVVLFIGLLAASGCTAAVEEPVASEAESAYSLFMSEGLSCRCMATLRALPEIQADEFRVMVRESMTPEEIGAVIEAREQGCASTGSETVGSVVAPITGTYSVEPIEETSGSGGYQPVAIYVDGPSFDNMCGGDGDYIAEFDNVSGAYSNRSSLKIRGTNIFASCYISNPTAARVYSDDDIRACIGYWSVYFCGAVAPLTSEIRVWVN